MQTVTPDASLVPASSGLAHHPHNPVWHNLTAGDVMTRKVYTVPLDWSVEQLSSFLTDHDISGAPVVDESGLLCGVVSATDIVHHTANGILDTNQRALYSRELGIGLQDSPLSADEMSMFHEDIDQTAMVADIMTPVAFSVDASMPLSKIADAMVRAHIHRVLVTEDKRLIGIISVLDMLSISMEQPLS
ncbi:CBS domain-containing protein [Parendozoicomonas haliclonae]|uniref:Inosine 5'-monophosphate dehydrogenase n=1 Tax=Parendozoicomonas haliclonae TaxID=1960125 RepID=A0A1X7AHK3_9GAMM|nr:CBS domain-containing protein [Parendozoicomonas haliclonae]SMA43004.1 inosine 5'-monophosphate dehydrogenase [Parendozoicomonas haliclonae]